MSSAAERAEWNASGAEAATYSRAPLEEYFKAPFDQVLLDVRKLESDGGGVCARLRRKAVLGEALIARYVKSQPASCSKLAPVRIQRDLKVRKASIEGG